MTSIERSKAGAIKAHSLIVSRKQLKLTPIRKTLTYITKHGFRKY